MRVTNSMITGTVVGNLNGALERLTNYQNQVSSGKRITRASDDPAGTGRSMALRSSLADTEQYAKNIDGVTGRLKQMDVSLGNISGALAQTKRLALSGGSSTMDSTQRGLLANQVQSQIDSVLNEVNGKYLGSQLYGGHKTDTIPVAQTPTSPPAYAYNGDDGVTRVQVSDNTTMDVSLTAKQILNFDGATDSSVPDVLSVMTGLKEDIASGNLDGITEKLKQLDTSYDNVLAQRGAVGVKSQQLNLYSDRLADAKQSLSGLITDNEEVDLTEAVTGLQREQNAYQASLIAASQIIHPSLADFLK